MARKVNRWINLIKDKIFHKKINSKMQRDKLVYSFQKKEKPDKLDERMKKELSKKYKSDVKKLGKLLNRDLSIWKI